MYYRNTQTYAETFISLDIQSYLFIALVILLIVAGVERYIINKKEYASENKSNFHKLIRFVLFLRTSNNYSGKKRREIINICTEIYPVLLLVFMVRGVVIEPFKIPSNSMMPGLLTGDFIVVSKSSYGINIPILNKKIIGFSKPKRGDVIVFRYPNYEVNPEYSGTDFVKRIIGIPGDIVDYKNNILNINGIDVDTNYIGQYVGFGAGSDMTGFKHISENIEGKKYDILNSDERILMMNKAIRVPKGHYFVMGDNRSRSSDSRFWGFVPEEYIIGKAFGIAMHWDDKIRLGRIGGID